MQNKYTIEGSAAARSLDLSAPADQQQLHRCHLARHHTRTLCPDSPGPDSASWLESRCLASDLGLHGDGWWLMGSRPLQGLLDCVHELDVKEAFWVSN